MQTANAGRGHLAALAAEQRAPRDLREWIARAEATGHLRHVRAPVDRDEEMSAITYMVAREPGAPALLFDRVTGSGTESRVLFNMLGSSKERLALSVGLPQGLSLHELVMAFRERFKHRRDPSWVEPEAAPVNEHVLTGEAVDLTRFPAPKFWPLDGGRYIGTGDITLTRNPETGRVNMGVYRQMLHGPRRVGLYCSPGKHALLDREAWWQRGESAPVVAAFGVDPLLMLLGSQSFPRDVSELDVAGGAGGEAIEMTRGVTVDLPIPARAEIVIEGLMRAGDVLTEGPLGETTGYYGSLPSPQPVIEVTALHHRTAPILTASLMADYPAGDNGLVNAVVRAARVWDDLDALGVPGIRGVFAFPAAASGFGMLAVSLEQRYAGHAAQVLALAAQCPGAAYFCKWIIAVDEDVDPTDIGQVLWAMSVRSNPVDDIDVLRNTWSSGIDPSQFPPEQRPYASKALINACKNHRYLAEHPKRTSVRRSIYERVRSRWQELDLPGTPPELLALEEG